MAARFLFAGGGYPYMNSSIPPDCLLSNCTVGCLGDGCLLYLPPHPLPADDSFLLDVHHKTRLLSTFLISAASLIASSFLLLLLLYSLIRRRRLLRQPHQQPPPTLDPGHDDVLLENDGDDDNTPHHVWLIRTVGLDETVIKSIAAAVYKAGEGLVDGGDCTVCLGEFVDGEVVKILPKCSHAFHLSCIDTWLRSHVNCPICRAPVVAAPAGESAPSDSTQIEIPPPQQPSQEDECAVAIDLEAGSSSSGPLGDSAEDESEVQPIRRSVSMDSSSLGMLMLRVESEPEEEKLGEEKNEVEFQTAVALKSNKAKGVDSLGKLPGLVEMKRSLSSRSGRMFFSRYRRGRSTSVLPL